MNERPTAKTIRLYCDGELPEREAREVEQQLQRDPRLARGLAFEQKLRERVGAVLQAEGSPVPAELDDRVRQAMAGGGEPRPATAHRAWWRASNGANVFAVAASLALVVGAVLFGILGPQIDTLRSQAAPGMAVETAAAVAGEHVMAATTGLPVTKSTAPYGSREEIEQALTPYLSPPSGIFDLSDLGYEFVSGMACDLPNCERGCHLFYRKTVGQPGLVSLHVVPDHGQCDALRDAFAGDLPLSTGVVPQSRGCQKDVLVWSHEGRTYLLVVCISRDVQVVVQRMQEALVGVGMPARPSNP